MDKNKEMVNKSEEIDKEMDESEEIDKEMDDEIEQMDDEILLELIENQSIDDEILYLKSDIQIIESNNLNEEIEEMNEMVPMEEEMNEMVPMEEEMNEMVPMEEEMNEMVPMEEEMDMDKICWSNKIESEPCCISIHPKFPNIPQVAIGTCGDNCHIYDFNNNSTNNGLKYILGPFEETVSCCSFSSCGNFLALGCLNSTLLLFSINVDSVTVSGTTETTSTTTSKVVPGTTKGTNTTTTKSSTSTNTTTTNTTNNNTNTTHTHTNTSTNKDTNSSTPKVANSTYGPTVIKGPLGTRFESQSSNPNTTNNNKDTNLDTKGNIDTNKDIKDIVDTNVDVVVPNTVTEEYKLMKKFDTMLLTIEWLNFNRNNKILCCSGEGGLLFIYNFLYNNIQFINIFHNSNIGFVFSVTVSGTTESTGPTNTNTTVVPNTNNTTNTTNTTTTNSTNTTTTNSTKDTNNSTKGEDTSSVTGASGREPDTVTEENYIILNSNDKLLIIKYNIITNTNNIITIHNKYTQKYTYKMEENIEENPMKMNKLNEMKLNKLNEMKLNKLNEMKLNKFNEMKMNKSQYDKVPVENFGMGWDGMEWDEIITIEMNEEMGICIYGTLNGIITFVNMKGMILSSNNIHRDSIESIIYNKRGNIYVSGDLSGLILFYNNNFNIINKIDIKIGITKILQFNNYYIISTVHGIIFLITLNHIINKFKLHSKPISNLQLLHQYIITISQDHTIKMY